MVSLSTPPLTLTTMRDMNESVAAFTQRASGTIEILDYSLLSGKTFTVAGTTLTEGADFNATTDNDTTAAALATAIDGIATISASANGAVITVIADAPGTGGNSKGLATNADPEAATVSGATLTGGVAQTYSTPQRVQEGGGVDIFLNLTALVGTSLDVTPEVSANGVDYYPAEDGDGNAVAFTQFTGAGKQKVFVPLAGAYIRLKFVLAGSLTSATLDYQMVETCQAA